MKRNTIEHTDNGDLVLPTPEEWTSCYERFRTSLSELYEQSEDITNDTQFCKTHDLARSQFSRVLSGAEKPSPKIMEALKHVFPEIYDEYARRWKIDRQKDIPGPIGTARKLHLLLLKKGETELADRLNAAVNDAINVFSEEHREQLLKLMMEEL